jgi:hypothetical protein
MPLYDLESTQGARAPTNVARCTFLDCKKKVINVVGIVEPYSEFTL